MHKCLHFLPCLQDRSGTSAQAVLFWEEGNVTTTPHSYGKELLYYQAIKTSSFKGYPIHTQALTLGCFPFFLKYNLFKFMSKKKLSNVFISNRSAAAERQKTVTHYWLTMTNLFKRILWSLFSIVHDLHELLHMTTISSAFYTEDIIFRYLTRKLVQTFYS